MSGRNLRTIPELTNALWNPRSESAPTLVSRGLPFLLPLSLKLRLSAERDGAAQGVSRIDLVQVPEPSGAARILLALLTLAGAAKLRRRSRRE